MSIHPWHDVTIGENAPEIVRAVVEIPIQSKSKYELDKSSGMLVLDRVLYSSIIYPANYGFIPQTLCDDGDPLDILIISQVKIVPLCLVEAKVIGVMEMLDGNEADDKIIAVVKNDMSVNHINDISELPEHNLIELKGFFEDYKKLENKTVKVKEMLGRETAIKIINKSIKDYEHKFNSR